MTDLRSYIYLVGSDGNDYSTNSFLDFKTIGHDSYKVVIMSFTLPSADNFEFLIHDLTTGANRNLIYREEWKPSVYIQYFKIVSFVHESDRQMLELVIQTTEPFDLLTYTRDRKIRQVISSRN